MASFGINVKLLYFRKLHVPDFNSFMFPLDGKYSPTREKHDLMKNIQF